MDNKFTWLPFYKELSNWLLGKQNSQLELISKLKEIGITGFRDGTEKGKEITLQEIDPFTFLSYLNKFHSDERRVEILQDLRHKLNFSCPEPTDVSGIPTTHPMKVHLFPWKTIRGNNDINVLWKLFGQVKEGKVDERLFQTALNIKSVGKGKLSIVLFYANPEKYVPLDSNTSSYLRSKKLGYTYDSFASVSIRSTTGIKPLYTTIATVTMNLIVSAAIVLLNPYVTVYISYKIPPFALSVHIPDVSTSIYVEVDSKVLLGLPFCDKASGRLHHSGTPLGLHRVPYR